jgi:predicted metal-dependent hydrolase
MKRAVRNRLVDLLLESFRNPSKRDALQWLALYCESSRGGRDTPVPAEDLEREWARRHPDRRSPGTSVAADLEGLLALCGGGRQSGPDAGVSRGVPGGRAAFAPHPEFSPFVCDARVRIRAYAEVVERTAGRVRALEAMEPLRRAVAEAAMCFDSGLFYEAHELLEHHWVGLPKGGAKRFLQGLIQISVGFHHAVRGSYPGAVNQLEKGLAKLAEPHDDSFGLDCGRFLREVAAARRRIVERGRPGMRPARLDEIPRMYLAG